MMLKDMSRTQLAKTARKYGVKPLRSMSDVELRKAIRAAKRKKPTTTKSNGKAAWPKEWPEEMRDEYYMSIVGAPTPANSKKAYATLVKAIDAKVPKVELTFAQDGKPNCFGVFYDATLKGCNQHCPEMPLCKEVCAQRPELLEEVRAGINKAVEEVEALSEEEVKAAKSKKTTKKKTTKKKTTKKKTTKKPRLSRRHDEEDEETLYIWTGKVSDYEENSDADEEELEVYRWMASRRKRGFSFDECAKQFGEYYEDPEIIARETIDILIEQGDVSEK